MESEGNQLLETRTERIARYKAERRRELAERYHEEFTPRNTQIGKESLLSEKSSPIIEKLDPLEISGIRSGWHSLHETQEGKDQPDAHLLLDGDKHSRTHESLLQLKNSQNEEKLTMRSGKGNGVSKEKLLEHGQSSENRAKLRLKGEDVEVPESAKTDALAKLSVAAKMSMFKELEKRSVPESAAFLKSRPTERRLRRLNDRCRTQPITTEEVEVASGLPRAQRKSFTLEDQIIEEAVNTADQIDTTVCEDESSRLSISEKLALFNKLAKPEPKPQTGGSNDARRRQKGARYRTQPITITEVELLQKHGDHPSNESAESAHLPSWRKRDGNGYEVKLGQPVRVLPQLGAPLDMRRSVPQLSDGEKVEIKGILKKRSVTTDDVTYTKPLYDTEEVVEAKSNNDLVPERHQQGEMHEPSVDSAGVPWRRSRRYKKNEKDTASNLATDREHSMNGQGMVSGLRSPIQEENIFEASDDLKTEAKKDETVTLETSTVLQVSAPWRHSRTRSSSSTSEEPSRKEESPVVQHIATAAESHKDDHKPASTEVPERDLDAEVTSDSHFLLEDETDGFTDMTTGIRERCEKLLNKDDSKNKSNKRISDVFQVPLAQRCNQLYEAENAWRKKKTATGVASSVSLAERKLQITEKEEQWKQKGKGAFNDSVQFTVAGRMAKKGLVSDVPGGTEETPIMTYKKGEAVSVQKPSEEIASNPDVVVEGDSQLDKLESFLDKLRHKGNQQLSITVTEETVKEVVRPDDDETFNKFYRPVSTAVTFNQLSVDDFSVMLSTNSPKLTTELADHKRSVRPVRRVQSSRNPLRTLAAREDLKHEYMEQRLNVASLETRRIQAEKMSKHSNMSIAALAGLASKENFKKVNLRDVKSAEQASGSSTMPYSKLMLLQVKGRRHVQTRLVEPCTRSLNSGDCFLLVTPQHCFLWIGEFANVIERAKASELAAFIQTKRDLGCKASQVVTIEEAFTYGSTRNKDFWNLLGGEAEYLGAGEPEEDEMYESAAVETNCIYSLQGFEVLFLQHKIILTYRSYNKKAGSNRFTKCTSTNQRLWISSLGQIPKPPLQNSVLKTSAPQHQDLEFNLHFRLSSVWSMHVFPVSV